MSDVFLCKSTLVKILINQEGFYKVLIMFFLQLGPAKNLSEDGSIPWQQLLLLSDPQIRNNLDWSWKLSFVSFHVCMVSWVFSFLQKNVHIKSNTPLKLLRISMQVPDLIHRGDPGRLGSHQPWHILRDLFSWQSRRFLWQHLGNRYTRSRHSG